VTLPADLRGKEQFLKNTIENTLTETDQGKYYTVITFDPET